MDLDSLDDDDAEQLAARIGPHLDPGSYGDRVVLTKRQFVAAATGVAGAGALATWGVDDATAQAAGSVGTASSPVDVFGYDVDVSSSLAMNGNDIENAGSVNTDSINLTELLNLNIEEKTISSGEITFSSPAIILRGEGGSADTLDSVAGGSAGDTLLLLGQAEDITITHASGGSGDFRLGNDSNKTLSNIGSTLLCVYRDGAWVQVAFNN